MASTQHSLRPESRLGAVYCTRVGIYWSGVVRTARAPDPHSVHPTLVQWHPTLVEWTNIVQTIKDTRPVVPHPRGVDTGRKGGIDSVVPWRRSRPRRPPSRSYLMPRVRGFRVRTGDLPYEREALTQGRARRPGLSWSGVVRTARSPGKPPNQCLRCHDIRNSQKRGDSTVQ